MLKAVIYNEFHGTKVELGPYYVEIGREAVSVFMNSSSVHEDEVLVFTDSQVNQKSKTYIWSLSKHPSVINEAGRLCFTYIVQVIAVLNSIQHPSFILP